MICNRGHKALRDLFCSAAFRRVYAKKRHLTHHDQSEGDHDSSQQLVRYGVLFERVPDGLIVAEETPFERVVLRGKDEKWKSNCSKNKEKDI